MQSSKLKSQVLLSLIQIGKCKCFRPVLVLLLALNECQEPAFVPCTSLHIINTLSPTKISWNKWLLLLLLLCSLPWEQLPVPQMHQLTVWQNGNRGDLCFNDQGARKGEEIWVAQVRFPNRAWLSVSLPQWQNLNPGFLLCAALFLPPFFF